MVKRRTMEQEIAAPRPMRIQERHTPAIRKVMRPMPKDKKT
jgi:hypothetical protein